MTLPTTRGGRIALLTATALLAIVFTFQGVTKVIGMQGQRDAFETWMWPLWFMYVVGAYETLAAVLFILPRRPLFGARTRFWGAVLVLLVMPGAVYTHLRVGQNAAVGLPVAMFLLALYVGWVERPPFVERWFRRPVAAP